MRSIHHELLIRILGGTIVLLLATSTFILWGTRMYLIEEYDEALEAKSRVLATLVSREDRKIEVNFAGEYMPEFETATEPEFFEFRLQEGTVIERSDSLGDIDLPFENGAANRSIIRNLRLPDGRRGRSIQIGFPPRFSKSEEKPCTEPRFAIPDRVDPEAAFVVLTIARSREKLDSQLLSLYMTIGAVDIAFVVLTAILVRRSIRMGFRPIEAMNAQIREIDPVALDRRIEMPDAPDEIRSVPLALNSLLKKGQEAFARERRFSSDVAHELRTPVAELRTACEVGARWPDDPKMARGLFEDIFEIAQHMEQIVCNLLELTRCDSGRIAVEPSAVAVGMLVENCWMRYAREADRNKLRLVNRITPALVLETDRAKLDMIMQNLLGNAVSYGVADTEVVCECQINEGTVRLSVLNQTDDIEQGDLPHVTERFWRKQQSRTPGSHSGLGLSIVRSFADVLGICLQIDLKDSNIFQVSLFFPIKHLLQTQT